ncbi:DUF1990 domain-containing protein [Streptomyces sp. TLI_053]|uniref:DUF1990 family protein n=1 Tax=Streptomyces sp. TLI_053 TaxID=1855352 RepID=UPI0013520E5E
MSGTAPRSWPGPAASSSAGAVSWAPGSPCSRTRPPSPGATVLLRLGLPGSRWPRLVIPCRVVWTVDEPDRIGFAYGTLPGHPECGEEAFLVSMDAAGEVWFEVVAFARLAAWYARLGRPVAVLCQYLAIERYLASVLAAAADPGSDPDPGSGSGSGAPLRESPSGSEVGERS